MCGYENAKKGYVCVFISGKGCFILLANTYRPHMVIYSFYILSQTLYLRLFLAVLYAGKASESSSRNSRLAACIILPEICSRGFSLRPLFDALYYRGRSRLENYSLKSARLRMWPSKVSLGSAYTYTCMHESLASYQQAFSSQRLV